MDGILIENIIDFLGLKPGAIIIGLLSLYLFKIAVRKCKENKRQAKNEAKKLNKHIQQENDSLRNTIVILSEQISRLNNKNLKLNNENILLKEKNSRLECELQKYKEIEMKGGN